MKKIIFINGSQSRTGGTERVCADVCNSLSECESYDITILSFFKGRISGFSVSENVKLDELTAKEGSGYLYNLYISFLLFFYVLNKKPDILVGVESLTFINMVFIRLIPKRPKMICWEHFNLKVNLGVKLRDLSRWLAASLSDKVVVLSLEDKKNWKVKFSKYSSKILHIYNPNPFEHISIDNNFSQLSKPKKTVLAVGRLTYQKGFDLLLESWSMIPDSVRSQWILKIVGEGVDREKLEKLVIKYNISESVILAGHKKNIANEYESADIFALSSRFEGFGLVLLEALSYQLPVISYSCPAGPSEIIFDGINGYLVDNGNVKVFSEKLCELMSNDKLLEEFKTNTNYKIERFSRNNVIKKWNDLLKI